MIIIIPAYISRVNIIRRKTSQKLGYKSILNTSSHRFNSRVTSNVAKDYSSLWQLDIFKKKIVFYQNKKKNFIILVFL